MASPFRDLPDWQRAHADYVDAERTGEHEDDVFARRVRAALDLHRIEKQQATGGDAA